MNARRKALFGSWARAGGAFVGTDGARSYRVEPTGEGKFRVLVDGEVLRSRSHRVARAFGSFLQACWEAEVHAERTAPKAMVDG
jgi:hypothetical protein